MKKLLLSILLLALALPPALAGEQTILITSNDASGVYYTSKGGVKMEMSGGMNNEGYMVQRHYDQINFRSFNFKIKKIVFRCLDNSVEGDNDSFYWGPTTMYIAPNTSVGNVVAGTLTTPYSNSTYMAKWESSPTYPDGLPIGQQLTIKCQGHPVRFAYIEITIDKEDGDMYELVTQSDQIVTGDKTYMLVHRLNSSNMTGDALSSNQEDESTSGHFLSTPIDLYNNGFLAKATGDVMFLRFSKSNNTSYPYYIIAGGAYLRTESSTETVSGYTTKRLSRTNGMNLPSNTDYALASVGIYESQTGGTNGFDYYALMGYKGVSGHRIRHYNAKGQFRNIQNNNSYVAQQRVFLYKPAQKYDVFAETDGNGTITLRDGVVIDGDHNYSQMMDNVTFIVAPAEGYKVKNVTITNLTDNSVITPTVTTTTLGQNYAFSMPASDVRIYAEFEKVQYHNITMEIKPSNRCGNIFLTDGYLVQNDNVMSYEGENVVFKVTANLIDIENESTGYYELSYVTVKNHATGTETTIAANQLGNYNFTMPDADVTITAYFFDNSKAPLWLLGTANGNETWHTYGPRFNYNDETDEYYIDVYFKGTGNYGDNTGEAYGRFSVTWKIDLNDNWNNINNQNLRGVPGEPDFLVDENSTAATATYLWYGSAYENNSYKIPAGIYRIYVGTTASQNKGNLASNQLKIEKYNIDLTLDPAGGATAAEAVEVPQGQVVTLNGDLYNKIKAINPNEADANFYYKTVETIDGTTPETNTANGTATGTASLDVVNDGETVTQLEGWNYLGWIVADNSGYYKVISTPLHWIEQNGDPGKTYTVADQLLGVYAQDGHLWAKDLGNISIAKTEKVEGDIDMMAGFATFMATQAPEGMRSNRSDWDQSNWVELNFGENTTSPSNAAGFVGKLIKAGTVKGTYADSRNYRIDLDQLPEEDGTEAYEPNYYSTVNFMCMNQTRVPSQASTGKMYYFLNPKIQEYSLVTFAVWDAANHVFVVPTQDGADNADNLDGAFSVNWGLNAFGDQTEGLDNKASVSGAQSYIFHAIVRVPEAASAAASAPAYLTGKNVAPTADYVVFPLDLQDNDANIVTAVSDVRAAAQAKGVEYINIAGQRSATPWQGVNIVVTHYDNGTSKAVKVIK